MQSECEPAGYDVFIACHDNHRKREEEILRQFARRRVDGIIVLAGRLSDEKLTQLTAGVPTVVVGRQVAGPQLYSFGFDNRLGAKLATVGVPLLHIAEPAAQAARVASLFYLIPPVTALMTWFVIGERMGALAMLGMAVTVAGVAMAVRRQAL